MKDFIEVVKKKKWRIRFVPWSKSKTGIMFAFKNPIETKGDTSIFALTRNEAVEFSFDMIEATIDRYDVEFPNDIKPSKTRQEVIEMHRNAIEKMKKKRARIPYYIR